MMLHFIRHDDTLQSIAEQINLENPVYIKEFHNQHCAREDYIVENLVAGRKLFLPDYLTIQKYNSRNDAPFKSPERNPKINFHPENLNIQYKVSITESSFVDHKKTENSFSYQFSLKWIKNELNQHIFHLSKNNFSIQNQTKIGDMAVACFQSIDPIEIQTDPKGEIISIKLLKKTIKNFPETKANLVDRFPDQYAKIYIDEFEYAVLNQELFQKKMKQDWLIKTYFAPIRNDFKNGKSHFQIMLENELLDINQTAEISENNDEFILNQDLAKVDYQGKYILSKDNGLINSLEINHSYIDFGVVYSSDFKIDKLG